MLSKRIISEIRALHQFKIRKQEGLFIVEGEKVVKELLNSHLKIKCVAGLSGFLNTLGDSASPGEVYEVSESELERISLLSTPNKVLAVVEIPDLPLLNINSFEGPAIVLDGIKDPGNLGTIIRTAEWFGVKAVFCSNDCVDCYNPKVVQSAMGSLFRMPVYYENLPVLLKKVKESGLFSIAGATLHGNNYTSLKISFKSLFLMIGSESHGISPDSDSLLDYRISIQNAPGNKAESLNAAVACGILLNEFQKA